MKMQFHKHKGNGQDKEAKQVIIYLNFIERTQVLIFLHKIILTIELVRVKEVKEGPVTAQQTNVK